MMPSVPSIPLTAASLAQTFARASLNGKREDSNPVVNIEKGIKARCMCEKELESSCEGRKGNQGKV